MVVIERASSLSSVSSTRKTEKGRSLEKDTIIHDVVKGKSVKRASSFSSIKKEKQVMSSSSPKHGHERLKSKLMPRASSFSSLTTSSLKKEKLIRGGSSLSTSNVESPKRARKSLSGKVTETRKSSTLKSKIKELGPICKKRKEVLSSVGVDDEFEVCFDKQINEGTMINPDDCFWLSSGSMSPQEFGLFMSALDPCLDEWVISFVPQSTNASTPAPVKPEVVTSEETLVQEATEESIGAASEDPATPNSLALSTYTNNSAFWNMDRTGVWVSLINLEGEDSRLISDDISGDEELDSNFPSPTHQEINWDAYSSDVGISSSARSTQESSHSDWSSDLLSDSLDWDLDSEDPIFWPFGLESGWNPNLESFSVSPRKGAYETGLHFEDNGNGNVSPSSIKFRLHASREGSKDGFRKKILFVSGLSASKIIEFKKGYRKKIASSKRSQIGKRVGRFKRRVPPILETDLEGISPKETPTKETQELVSFASDMMSGSEDWGDEMDSDGPLVWPNDQRTDWNVTCDFLNISPRKNVVNITNFGSPKGGFTISGSIRLKFRSNKKSKTKSGYSNTLPGLGVGASKNFKFKPGSSHRRGKARPLRLSPSCKSLVVIVPPKKISLFKPSGYNHGITRINANHGKRIRSMPLQMGRSAEEFIRMLSAGNSVNRKFRKAELTSEENPIETAMGLSEFNGHEGVDMDFEEGNFSFEEFRNA